VVGKTHRRRRYTYRSVQAAVGERTESCTYTYAPVPGPWATHPILLDRAVQHLLVLGPCRTV